MAHRGTPRSSNPGFKWSHSRGAMLEGCPHRYYLHYYAAKNAALPGFRRTQQLRYASNRYFQTGKSLHLAIEWYLKKNAAERRRVSAADLAGLAVARFDNDRTVSRRFLQGVALPRPVWRNGKKVDGPVLLMEYLTGEADVEESCDERAALMATGIARFVETDALAAFRDGAHHRDAVIESLRDVTLARLGFEIYVKVDLLYPTGDGVDLVDWKSGPYKEDEPNHAQLTIYALWASQVFGVPTDSIRAVTVYLGDGSIVETRLTPAQMQQAVADIGVQIQAMVALDAAGVFGDEDDFPKRPSTWGCATCAFLMMCEEGRAVIGDDLTYPGRIHLTPA